MNPYAYTQVNIREQDSWAHGDDPAGATEKAIGLVRAGIAKTRNSTPLEPLVVETTSATMVVGGGIAGLRAAIGLADVGTARLSGRARARARRMGRPRSARCSPPTRVGREQIDHLIAEVAKRPLITVFTNAELVGKSGSFGNYLAEVRVAHETTEMLRAHGRVDRHRHRVRHLRSPKPASSATASTGSSPCRSSRPWSTSPTASLTYGGKPVRTIAYIYCVGSRQPAGGNAVLLEVLLRRHGARLDPGVEARPVDPPVPPEPRCPHLRQVRADLHRVSRARVRCS